MHGLGNDFIVVDLRRAPPGFWFDDPGTIVALCDRRFGVGADGVLAILVPSSKARADGAVARMRIRNADGSEAEMCGNGLRCVARYLAEKDGLGPALRIETGAGVLSCTLVEERHIEVAMGAPRWNWIERPFPIAGASFSITTVSMGNPHAVIFCSEAADAQALRLLAERHGPAIECHPQFPQRTNVEFVYSQSRESYTALVWERGCGITLACGTGACAVAVAACLTGRAEPGRWLTVNLLGGALSLRVEPSYEQVHMRGPAVTVYQGQMA